MKGSFYHFHKDCIYYDVANEKKEENYGHNAVRLWCPKVSEELHKMTGVRNGRPFNQGEAYDRSGGRKHYPGDLHTVKCGCKYFEPIENKMPI